MDAQKQQVLTRADGKRMLFHDCENPAKELGIILRNAHARVGASHFNCPPQALFRPRLSVSA